MKCLKQMRFLGFLLSVMFIFDSSVFVIAADCEFLESFRNPFTPERLKCTSGAEGYIKKDETRLKQLKVIVSRRTGGSERFVLDNPPGVIRDYAVVGNNDWVISRLNLRFGDEVQLLRNGYVIDDQTPIYDSSLRNVLMSAGGRNSRQSSTSSRYDCSYSGLPSLIQDPQCGQKICIATGICIDHENNGESGIYTLACHANSNNTCPTAQDCAESPTVDVLGTRIRVEQPRSFLRQRGSGNQQGGLGN